jgi:hypothetical protein
VPTAEREVQRIASPYKTGEKFIEVTSTINVTHIQVVKKQREKFWLNGVEMGGLLGHKVGQETVFIAREFSKPNNKRAK